MTRVAVAVVHRKAVTPGSPAVPRGHAARDVDHRASPLGDPPVVDAEASTACSRCPRCPGRSMRGGTASASLERGHGRRRSAQRRWRAGPASIGRRRARGSRAGLDGRASSSAPPGRAIARRSAGGADVASRVAGEQDHAVGRLERQPGVQVVLRGPRARSPRSTGTLSIASGRIAVAVVQRPGLRRRRGRSAGSRRRARTARRPRGDSRRRLAACAPARAARYASARMPARSKWTRGVDRRGALESTRRTRPPAHAAGAAPTAGRSP